jgi:DnaJ-class molecular chaperone
MSRTQTQTEGKEGILLKCPHNACGGKIWRYKGTMKVYAICPDCRGSVHIVKNKIIEEG